ncbi:MAG: hypothetical protein R2710_17635 [Acidimicrobiales bacterium]
MFGIGGGEFLVIALVALIAVGPEQLPSVMRKFGNYVAQLEAWPTVSVANSCRGWTSSIRSSGPATAPTRSRSSAGLCRVGIEVHDRPGVRPPR